MKKFLLFLAFLCVPALCFAVSGYPQKAKIITKTLDSANTEYQIELPVGTSGFTMQSRTAADFKWGNASTSNIGFYTVKSGTVYSTPTPLNMAPSTPNTTLFIQSATAGQVIEIVAWQ